ncbi:class I SAM-dependent methyltransferase [Rhodococcus tukisamuensis]|uniref:Methyltransferase domain-containing protein n=1 Tax=Rhodococcus tukisamuensis TaxID=168276 RepID=A0A1G6RM38_9NOCA|nr:class I SAM-dependent methyltransferase [Rhodococcus tukisamuensis]SDD05065.1 Methyltransferase domain-containing protein [Rhodococcus tukisamuensis]
MRLARAGSSPIPSPNIWHWPEIYEVENRAQDADGAIFAALRDVADWSGRDVLDLGCGAGFHLPQFARDARSVTGVEPHRPLVDLTLRRVRAAEPPVTVLAGSAERIPLPDDSVDVVHARTAYFFGPGCGAGIVESMRVLRPGGVLAVVDLDATVGGYGEWMRADLPHYDAAKVEAFFAAQGFGLVRVRTRWEFDSREAMRSVLGIEFTERTAERAFAQTPGLALEVGYRIHTRRAPVGLVL